MSIKEEVICEPFAKSIRPYTVGRDSVDYSLVKDYAKEYAPNDVYQFVSSVWKSIQKLESNK